MKHKRPAIVGLATLLCSLASFSQGGDAAARPPVDSAGAVVRGTHVVPASINSTLPLFNITVEADSAWGEIGSLRVTRKGDDRAEQSLLNDTLMPADPAYSITEALLIEDINFDGYKDIRLLDSRGSGGRHYFVWLFDARADSFVYSSDMSGLWSLHPDPGTKTIQSSYREGEKFSLWQTYGFRGAGLLLLRSESWEWNDSTGQGWRTVRIRRNGVMEDSMKEAMTGPH